MAKIRFRLSIFRDRNLGTAKCADSVLFRVVLDLRIKFSLKLPDTPYYIPFRFFRFQIRGQVGSMAFKSGVNDKSPVTWRAFMRQVRGWFQGKSEDRSRSKIHVMKPARRRRRTRSRGARGTSVAFW
jgi:hypothetical protein